MASYGYFEKQKVKTGTKDIYEPATRQVRKFLGYERIARTRPKFVYFEFTGLKPDTPHWIFFDNKDVTKWINTDYSEADYLGEERGSSIRNPGDKYKDATQFPSEKGGPTNGGSGPINSDSTGTINGYFFIQRNSTISFNVGSNVLTAIDLSVVNKVGATSYAQAVYKAYGLYEYATTLTETYDVFVRTEDIYGYEEVEVAPPTKPGTYTPSSTHTSYSTGNKSSSNDNDNWTPTFKAHYEPTYQTITYFDQALTHAQIQANRKNAIGKKFNINASGGTGNVGKTGSSGGGGGGNVEKQEKGSCCFIMLEARYGNGTMDEVVRRYRDEYMTDRNRRGYYKLAEVLVPLMRKSKAFKWVVTKTFADPLVSYGKYYYGQNNHGWIFTPVKNFWMKLFDILGGETEFVRENGEIV